LSVGFAKPRVNKKETKEKEEKREENGKGEERKVNTIGRIVKVWIEHQMS
jgi:hypothetical protein